MKGSKIDEFHMLYYVIKYPANGQTESVKMKLSYVTVEYEKFKHETVEGVMCNGIGVK